MYVYERETHTQTYLCGHLLAIEYLRKSVELSNTTDKLAHESGDMATHLFCAGGELNARYLQHITKKNTRERETDRETDRQREKQEYGDQTT